PLPERVSHISRTAGGNGFAARANLSDGSSFGRSAHQRIVHRAYRPVPGLPLMRNRLSFRGPVRTAGRSSASGDRKQNSAALAPTGSALDGVPEAAAVAAQP